MSHVEWYLWAVVALVFVLSWIQQWFIERLKERIDLLEDKVESLRQRGNG